MRKVYNIMICYLGAFAIVFAIPVIATIVVLSYCFVYWDFNPLLNLWDGKVIRALITAAILVGTAIMIGLSKDL
jgi:hypothetical protein